MEKIIESLKAKTSQSFFKRRSINRIFKIIYQTIEPLIKDQRFWRLVAESQKLIKSKLHDGSAGVSIDILNPAQNGKENQPPMGGKKSAPPRKRIVLPRPIEKNLYLNRILLKEQPIQKE